MRLPTFLTNLSLAVKLNALLVLVLGATALVLIALTTATIKEYTFDTGQQRAADEMGVFLQQLEIEEGTLLDQVRLLARISNFADIVATGNVPAARGSIIPVSSELNLASIQIVRVDGTREAVTGGISPEFEKAGLDQLIVLSATRVETTLYIKRGDQYLLGALTPLLDSEGRVVGSVFIAREFNTRYLQTLILQREGIHAALIERNQFVASTIADDIDNEFNFQPNATAVERALTGEIVVEDELSINDPDPDYIAYAPLKIGGRVTDIAVIIKVEASELLAVQNTVTNSITGGFLAAIFLALVTSILFLRLLVTRPLKRLTAATKRLASGDYHGRTDLQGGDEIGQLANDFDQMANAVESKILDVQTAREQAERADRAKSAFLTGMSHELRTPLNSVINFSKFVAAGDVGPVNEQQESLLNEVVGSGKHLLGLINDVLDMSKIESGSFALFVEDNVDLKPLLEAVVRTGQGLLADKPIQLISTLPPTLPLIRGDRQRLYQILLNLLSNACKFTDSGEIEVTASTTESTILIAVRDSGMGIAPEDHALVFEAFKQTPSGLRQEGGGTGLGMPISKTLAQAHGGDLWVESAVGQGSTFYLTIPIKAEGLVPVLNILPSTATT